MALKKREKVLGISATAAMVIVAYIYLFSGSGESLSSLRTRREARLKEVQNKQSRIEHARKVASRLAEWEKRSLPANPGEAQSKYQEWLRGVVERLNFRNKDITPPHGQKKAGVYTAYTFTIQGKVNLKQLVSFLYEFYSAGHLHLVKRLTVTPPAASDIAKNNRDLGVSITIEALLLPDNPRADKLSDVKRTLPASVDEYEKAIVGRNLFASYMSPKPPPPIVKVEQKPSFDHARFTKVTGFTEVDGEPPQVWLHYLPSPPPNGKELKLAEGEKFDFGELRGMVVRFHREEDRIKGVEIEMDGRRYLAAIGDNLRSAKELPK